jgi:hypothetical protein
MNYYLTRPDGERLHLGLDTMREFMFEAHPGLDSFAAVRAAIAEGAITDDAERVIPAEEFVGIVRAEGVGNRYSAYGASGRYRDGEGFIFCKYAFC